MDAARDAHSTSEERGGIGGEFKVVVGVSDPSEWELVVFDDGPLMVLSGSQGPQRSDVAGFGTSQTWILAQQFAEAPADPPLPSWCLSSVGRLAPPERAPPATAARPCSLSVAQPPAYHPGQLCASAGSSDRRSSPREAARASLEGREGRTSVAAHDADTCRPCIFEYHGVCDKGSDCSHCHFPHTARQLRRANPSQVKRNNVRRRLETRVARSDSPSSPTPVSLAREDDEGDSPAQSSPAHHGLF